MAPTIREIRDKIPPSVMQPNAAKSIAYAARDMLVFAVLCYKPVAFWCGQTWVTYLMWTLITGLWMWSIFVIGHDCGHGSFSNSHALNKFFGYATHSWILTPYDPWRISHHMHHSHTGDVDEDHAFRAIPMEEFDQYPALKKFMLKSPIWWPFNWPLYLLYGMSGCHFSPLESHLFKTAQDRVDCAASTLAVAGALVFWLTYWNDFTGYEQYAGAYPWPFATFFYAPFVVFSTFLTVITYLQHTHPEGEYYRGADWTFAKGAINGTVDRVFLHPALDNVMHHICTDHVTHHLFSNIPWYNLKKATHALIGDQVHQRQGYWAHECSAAELATAPANIRQRDEGKEPVKVSMIWDPRPVTVAYAEAIAECHAVQPSEGGKEKNPWKWAKSRKTWIRAVTSWKGLFGFMF